MIRFLFITILACSGSDLFAQCDRTQRPIVFVHGFLASGDTYAGQIKRFMDAGYCEDRLFVFDWNSVNGNGKKNDNLLSSFIDQVLATTGSKQIDLVGHSAGGGIARGYLIDSAGASKVAHYVHLGSRKWYTQLPWFANEKCLNIFSSSDKIMGTAGGPVDGASNLDLKDKDHYEVATSLQTFSAIYAFLHVQDSKDGETVTITTQSYPFSISGKAVYLGDNSPMQHAAVNLYMLDARTGRRKGIEPERPFFTDKDGNWGPYKNTDKHERYELELVPADKSHRTVSYFFEPFTTADNHIYLRGFPQGNAIATMIGNIPMQENQSAIVIYSATRAMIAGRDSVTVNGIPVSTSRLTPASKTVISAFLFDDGDGKSSGEPLKQFGTLPFLAGIDISLLANNNESHMIYFNGRTMVLPGAPSKDRIMIVVFN